MPRLANLRTLNNRRFSASFLTHGRPLQRSIAQMVNGRYMCRNHPLGSLPSPLDYCGLWITVHIAVHCLVRSSMFRKPSSPYATSPFSGPNPTFQYLDPGTMAPDIGNIWFTAADVLLLVSCNPFVSGCISSGQTRKNEDRRTESSTHSANGSYSLIGRAENPHPVLPN